MNSISKLLLSTVLAVTLPAAIFLGLGYGATPVYAQGPGDPDTSFNGSGVVTRSVSSWGFGSTDDIGYAVAISTTGEIVAGGFSGTGFGSSDFTLLRYNSNGTPDTAFSTDGVVTYTVQPSSLK